MIKYLRLIRFQNLLIVALTQYLMRWFIVIPILNNFALPIAGNPSLTKVYKLESQLDEFHFFLLVLSTVLLTAAGYVINDYFDRKTDLLNRPESVVVGKNIHRRLPIILHTVFNAVGILIGLYLSYYIGIIQLAAIYVIIAGLLWYYSTSYKRQFFIGNLLVALLTAIVPIMVALYEIPLLNRAYSGIMVSHNSNFLLILYWVSGFSFFAFLTTLIREIVKDIEDFEGDMAYGRNTLPIILGVINTKIIIIALSTITIIAIFIVYFKFIWDLTTLWYFIVTLVVPLLFIIYKIIIANEKRDYRFVSLMLKIVMLFGLGYSIVSWYIFTNPF